MGDREIQNTHSDRRQQKRGRQRKQVQPQTLCLCWCVTSPTSVREAPDVTGVPRDAGGPGRDPTVVLRHRGVPLANETPQ